MMPKCQLHSFEKHTDRSIVNIETAPMKSAGELADGGNSGESPHGVPKVQGLVTD